MKSVKEQQEVKVDKPMHKIKEIYKSKQECVNESDTIKSLRPRRAVLNYNDELKASG